MSVQELGIFPQVVYSEGRGQIGTRMWALDHNDDLDAFVLMVANSHWPGYKDSIPVQIETGPFLEEGQVWRYCGDPRTYQDVGSLPKHNKYKVVAQYALHRMTDCWPLTFPKPYHLTGTTLTMQVRGSGQYLLVSPAGIRAASPLLNCKQGGESLSASVGTRIIFPVSEYHVTCGRLTKADVDFIQAPQVGGGPWDSYLGTVNASIAGADDFLNCAAGTLLFDGHTITPMEVCDPEEPHRFQVTCVFKHRVILDSAGEVLEDCDGIPIGWNHDFVNYVTTGDKRSSVWGWKYLKMWTPESDCATPGAGSCKPRYPYKAFHYLFGAGPTEAVQGQECGHDVLASENRADFFDEDFCVDEISGT